jgi:hypothetical protein
MHFGQIKIRMRPAGETSMVETQCPRRNQVAKSLEILKFSFSKVKSMRAKIVWQFGLFCILEQIYLERTSKLSVKRL